MKKNMPNISKNIENIDKNKITDEKKSNIIYNIEYVSEFKNGNFYVISSELGELIYAQPELINMKKVIATINLNNSSPITISADNAVYNNINHDTKFYENVLMTYNEHTTNSDNLDLMFEKNLATLSNNIIYNNLNTKLEADKMEINLITKNSKIFMNNASDTIKIVSIN
jgi:lipopolysaccharide export system protein LptA